MLLSLLFSTKWRIYKGILASPRLLRQGNSRGCRSANCFFQQNLQKRLYRDLKWKKSFFKGEKPIPVVFFTKSNSSEQIYRNRRLKIHFQRCCASQNKTRKIKTNSNSIRYVLKNIFQPFYNINGVQ